MACNCWVTEAGSQGPGNQQSHAKPLPQSTNSVVLQSQCPTTGLNSDKPGPNLTRLSVPAIQPHKIRLSSCWTGTDAAPHSTERAGSVTVGRCRAAGLTPRIKENMPSRRRDVGRRSRSAAKPPQIRCSDADRHQNPAMRWDTPI